MSLPSFHHLPLLRPNTNLAQCVFDVASVDPHRLALIHGEITITYGQLWALIQQRSTDLLAAGVDHGKRVGLLLYNNIDYVVNFFALLALGAVVVPFNVRLTAYEIGKISDQSGLKCLISNEAFSEVLLTLQETQPHLKHLDLKQLGAKGFDALTSGLDPEPSSVTLPRSVETNTLATLVYTSGTTGQPKGVMLSHGNIWADALANIQVIEGQPTDRFVTVSPLFHVFGQTNVLMTAMILGGAVVLVEKFSPRGILEAIHHHEVTVLTAVPTMYQMMLTHLKDHSYNLESVRVCHSGAAAMPFQWIPVIEAQFGAPVQEGYGLSEATSIVCSNPLAGPRKAGTVGLPMPGVLLQVGDEDGEPLLPQCVGEIMVQGPIVMQGYDQNPELTAQKFKNGWLKTGDLGFLDGDGYLTIVNRQDDLINVGGVKVYPKEVEAILREHPAVADVAVTGHPSSLYHQEVWAYLVLNTETDMPANDTLYQFCTPYLAGFKIPKHFVWVEELPKTASGKIQRNKLTPF